MPITSTPNDTTSEFATSVFHDDETQELSNVQSANTSFIDSQANPLNQAHSKSLEKSEILNSSSTSLNQSFTQPLHTPTARRSNGTEVIPSSSPLNQSFTQPLHTPAARRSDGTEVIPSSSPLNQSFTQPLHTPAARRSDGTEVFPSSSSSPSKTPLPRASSNVLLFNHCSFPRSLTSRGKINTNSSSKRQLPSLPIVQTSKEKQFRTEELYNLLDQQSQADFAEELDRLTLSHVIQEEMIDLVTEEEDEEEEEEEVKKENILPNFFHQPSTSAQEKLFYSTTNVHIDEPKNLSLYTMTLGTVQLSASILLPYSILNGRRPVLKCSDRTNFKQVRSKQTKSTCQVTAIESSLNIKELQQNDILLKVRKRFLNLRRSFSDSFRSMINRSGVILRIQSLICSSDFLVVR